MLLWSLEKLILLSGARLWEEEIPSWHLEMPKTVPLPLLLHSLGCPLPTSLRTLRFGQHTKSLILSAQCSQMGFLGHKFSCKAHD